MQRLPNTGESSPGASTLTNRSLNDLTKSMWSSPSKYHPAAKKTLKAKLCDVKERMATKNPPGVFLEPVNVTVLPPCDCEDCHFIGYEAHQEAPASANPNPDGSGFDADVEAYKPVPFAGNGGTAALGGCKACFGTPVNAPFDAAACTCVGDDMFEALQAEAAAGEPGGGANMDPGSKL